MDYNEFYLEGKSDCIKETTKEKVEILFTPNGLYFTFVTSIIQIEKNNNSLYETTQFQNTHAKTLFKSKNVE